MPVFRGDYVFVFFRWSGRIDILFTTADQVVDRIVSSASSPNRIISVEFAAVQKGNGTKFLILHFESFYLSTFSFWGGKFPVSAIVCTGRTQQSYAFCLVMTLKPIDSATACGSQRRVGLLVCAVNHFSGKKMHISTCGLIQ